VLSPITRRVTLAFVVGLGLPTPVVAQSAVNSALPLLTNIRAIRTLSQDDGARGYLVRIRATVTHFDEGQATGLLVHDGHFGQFVLAPTRPDTTAVWRTLRAGDDIEIEGRTVRGGFAPNVQPDAIRKLGRAPLPIPKRLPYAALITGRHDCDYVEIEGVVQRTWVSSDPRARTMYAEVAIEEGVVRAAFWDYTAKDLDRFIDSRVRVRGPLGALFGHTEQLRGVSLFGGRTRDVVMLEPPPDPFSLPMRTIRKIYNYSSAGEVNRRIRVRGVVTCAIPGRPVEMNDFSTTTTFRYLRNVLYVKDGVNGGARIETEQASRVRPGDLVDVAGFPAITPGKPILRNAVFRVVGSEAEPAPGHVAPGNVLTPENDAELVRLDGQFLSVLTTPTERVLVLKVGETVFDAGFDRSTDDGALKGIRPGSLVSITGVYSYQAGPPPSFRLLLRSPRDVVLVAAAPWWTLRHTLVMVTMLGLAAGVGGVWVMTIGRRKRQQYHAVLMERSRVARELHDTLEQGLTGISLQLEAVAATLQTSPDSARQSLDVARQMLRYSLEETHRSVMDLRSLALESRDLPGALTDLARQMTLGTVTSAEVRVEGQPQRLDAAQEHHLLRIGLEALTNALKHANSTRIDIELCFREAETNLIVRDNGRGLGHVEDELPGDHFGLQGVRERVDKLGGVLRINSRPGEGTQLAVTVPIRQRAIRYS
jgi:two-component sensor histidine kinase